MSLSLITVTFILLSLILSLPITPNLGKVLFGSESTTKLLSPIIVDVDWTNFYFTNNGSHALGGNPPSPADFLINSIGPQCIQLTDLYCTGDVFDVYVNGTMAGTSSSPVGISCDQSSGNPNFTFNIGNWSVFSYDVNVTVPVLVDVVVVNSPYSAGQAAIRALNGPCS